MSPDLPPTEQWRFVANKLTKMSGTPVDGAWRLGLVMLEVLWQGRSQKNQNFLFRPLIILSLRYPSSKLLLRDIMVVQFCEDCGNLLDISPAEVLKCELCGKTAKSMLDFVSYSAVLWG